MKEKLRKLKFLLRVIFGRTTFVILSLLVQVGILIISLKWLSEYSTIVYTIFIAIGAITVIHILNEESNASFKMAWMIPVLIIPVFGTMLYLFVNMQLATKMMNKRLDSIATQLHPQIKQNPETIKKLADESSGELGLANYLHHVGNFPVYENNGVTFFPSGEDKFEEMQRQLKKAKKFIFMEYFIVAKGTMWDTILDILKEKVAEGVEVRFMYDGMCSLALLPYGYYKEIRKLGIECRPFSQIKPVLSTHQNNRDHRKILVIDGQVAFTGGVNLADEYINQLVRFGHWKDTAVMVEGEAVKSFTTMFLKMWNVAGKQSSIPEAELKKYVFDIEYESKQTDEQAQIPVNENVHHHGGFIIPYADEPFDNETIGKQVYIDILNRANKYVHIMTPYLILDDEMSESLCYSAKRGVETIIIMPHIPDKMYAYLLARTYYKELLENGVQIYEYTPGFIHAKLFVSDDVRASVGTINLDFRSLYLHFECSAYIYKNAVIGDVEQDFNRTLDKCEKITLDSCKKYPKFKKFIGEILRLFAPLM
jgi:cardiolipin synthase